MPNKKLVLFVMGSLGSSKVNEILVKTMKLFNKKDYEILFITGNDDYEKIKQNYNIRKVSTVIKSPVVLRKRIGELQKSWETFANAEITITDRLHAMLFSVLNGTPCIVLNNKTGKVFGVADWLDDTNMIVRANSLSEVLEKLKRTTIWEHKKYDREKLLNYFEKMAEVIRKD